MWAIENIPWLFGFEEEGETQPMKLKDHSWLYAQGPYAPLVITITTQKEKRKSHQRVKITWSHYFHSLLHS